MRITEAVWEKRNLGVSCIEVDVEKNDNSEDVLNELRRRKEQYIVVKIAETNPDALLKLQSEGYTFIETLFEVEDPLDKKAETPRICRGFDKHAGYHIASPEEERRVVEEVRKGTVFSSDRISIDPFFSRELAGRRYAYWIEDVLKAGATKIIIPEYDGESIGFIVVTDKITYHSPILAGLFTEYLDSGYGVLIAYCCRKCMHDIGAKKTVSHVSSNNFQMLKINLLFGNTIKGLKYILVKHSRDMQGGAAQ